MPPYEMIQNEYVFFVFLGGFGLTLLILLARGSRDLKLSIKKTDEKKIEEGIHEFGGEVREANHPVPWFIWVVLIGYFFWATGYIVFSGAVPI